MQAPEQLLVRPFKTILKSWEVSREFAGPHVLTDVLAVITIKSDDFGHLL